MGPVPPHTPWIRKIPSVIAGFGVCQIFSLPNKGSSVAMRTFVVAVDMGEELAGLDFFSAIPQPKQEQLERTVTVDSWNRIR